MGRSIGRPRCVFVFDKGDHESCVVCVSVHVVQ